MGVSGSLTQFHSDLDHGLNLHRNIPLSFNDDFCFLFLFGGSEREASSDCSRPQSSYSVRNVQFVIVGLIYTYRKVPNL